MWGLARKKRDYVNSIKACGCSSCGFNDPSLLRFLEMDHLHSKIRAVSLMVIDSTVTFEQFVEECAKCRVLCKFCHSVRTRLQIAELMKLQGVRRKVNDNSGQELENRIESLELEAMADFSDGGD